MITLTEGNLLEARVDAQVNAVNCEGVMGAGIALKFKQAYPPMFRDYEMACKAGKVNLGQVHVFDRVLDRLGPELGPEGGPRWIINFPTKDHWRDSSRMVDIETGLKDLVATVKQLNIRSIAIPALGCGNGGLDWNVVRPRIEWYFSELPDVQVALYAPEAKR